MKLNKEINGRGTIYSWTIVHDAPEGFEAQAPYVVAIVKLDEGVLITTQLTDLEKRKVITIIDKEERVMLVPIVEIGMEVEMVTRIYRKNGDNGVIEYGYKFRPRVR